MRYMLTDERWAALGPLALAFVGVSDKESVAQVKRCQERFGEQWIHEWVGRRGLSLGQYVGEAGDQDKEKEDALVLV